jgi:hypothetical protein
MKAALLAGAIAGLWAAQVAAQEEHKDFSHASAAETVDFIKAAVLDQGVLSYKLHVRDLTDKSEVVFDETKVQKDLRFDPKACTITMRQEFSRDGKPSSSQDIVYLLRGTSDGFSLGVGVEDLDMFERGGPFVAIDRNNPAPPPQHQKRYHASPAIWVVDVSEPSGESRSMFFNDRSKAQQVSDAVNHLIELCSPD